MAFTAVAALATYGGAAVTGVAVMTAMTYVGIAMTVIGAITKDKQLMKTGGLLSLVGGIGGAMSGAGSAGEAAAAGGAGEATAAGGVAGAGEAAGNAAASGLMGTGEAAAGSTLAQGAAPEALMPLSEPAVSGGLDTAAAMPAVNQSAVPPPEGASTSLEGALDNGLGPTSPMGAQAPSSPTIGGDLSSASRTGAPMDSSTFFSGIGKFWDSLGPQGKGMAIQQIGGAFSGAAETEKHNEIMDYRNRELALRSHGSATANYRRPGLINTPRT